MFNTSVLKCQLAKLIALYAQRTLWGFECNLDILLSRAKIIRNQIAILESTCTLNPSVRANIQIDINKIQNDLAVNLCTNCD